MIMHNNATNPMTIIDRAFAVTLHTSWIKHFQLNAKKGGTGYINRPCLRVYQKWWE
jgi:hypothetical protein